MKSIPVDQLQNKTSAGLQIKVFGPGDRQQYEREIAHRDDHYIFFVLTNGSGQLMVDLQDIVVVAGQLYYILPSQVHYRIKTDGAEGWFLAVDTSIIAPDLKAVFENVLNVQLPLTLKDYELKQYSKLLTLLHEEFIARQHDEYYRLVIHALAQSFLAMAASSYQSVDIIGSKHTRPVELVRQFKILLGAHSHIVKSPSAYASRLNVSTGYLNEAVKKVTGSTVSYWIQQEIFSEAKRLLFYSDADVKEIAHKLGYSDYAYFIRLFRKAAGVSPLKFRMLNSKA
ncbi:helix-turn-helix domain-containing protein [Mucilaginibacter ginsenosidivorax]|uniref:Helix-turn-helix domain-containing protein n=1 Tax=Mucilaginibacter ginsenosidivorax TaxID=862126 RepID=A0A5B8VTW4_9SPHI|nr:helix-turn-helix domain-containing protein [Mucilaginibacter ginsenosidivorax]QEC75047.1 helix-turn-helix domain-containing protein [Mucilaginibacter ginsenosidivorax]